MSSFAEPFERHSAAADIDWSFVCATGIRPWLPPANSTNSTTHSPTSPVRHQQLAPCFQQLFMQVPILALFAILSAYHCGRHCGTRVQRDRVQTLVLRLRCAAVVALASLPAAHLAAWRYYGSEAPPWPADWLLAGCQTLAYAAHAAYLMSLRRRGSSNHRGPLAVRVAWTSVFMMSVVWLVVGEAQPGMGHAFAELAVLLHCAYAVTLLPMGEARRQARFEPERNDVSIRFDTLIR